MHDIAFARQTCGKPHHRRNRTADIGNAEEGRGAELGLGGRRAAIVFHHRAAGCRQVARVEVPLADALRGHGSDRPHETEAGSTQDGFRQAADTMHEEHSPRGHAETWRKQSAGRQPNAPARHG